MVKNFWNPPLKPNGLVTDEDDTFAAGRPWSKEDMGTLLCVLFGFVGFLIGVVAFIALDGDCFFDSFGEYDCGWWEDAPWAGGAGGMIFGFLLGYRLGE